MPLNLSGKEYRPLGNRTAASRNTILGLSVLLAVSGMIIFCFLPPPRPRGVDKPSRPRALSADALRFLDSVRNGDFQAVQEELKAGADVNVQNEFGESALHVVRDPQVARFLIENGADVNLRERESGMTPIFFQGKPITEILVRAGADINARSNKGNTPFLWYTYSGYLPGLQFLIEAGADIQAQNSDGHTALDIADVFGDPELISFLEAAGVKRAARSGRQEPGRGE